MIVNIIIITGTLLLYKKNSESIKKYINGLQLLKLIFYYDKQLAVKIISEEPKFLSHFKNTKKTAIGLKLYYDTFPFE